MINYTTFPAWDKHLWGGCYVVDMLHLTTTPEVLAWVVIKGSSHHSHLLVKTVFLCYHTTNSCNIGVSRIRFEDPIQFWRDIFAGSGSSFPMNPRKEYQLPSKPRLDSKTGIHHVILRGINKQRIFEEDEDYNKFLQVLRRYQNKCDYSLLAYCLMSNHIHLLIKVGTMDLGVIFQHISPCFVKWYNAKYQRVGSLFQSRFKSSPVEDRTYLLTVIRYIHQNPVKAAVCNDPSQYKYSSLHDYFENDLIDKSIIMGETDEESFLRFNLETNNDQCMDIDDEVPHTVTDEKGVQIMQHVSGCCNTTEFQTLEEYRRDKALFHMWRAGVSIKQASRITGVSYGVIRRVVRKIDQIVCRAVYTRSCGTPPRGRRAGYIPAVRRSSRGYSSSAVLST